MRLSCVRLLALGVVAAVSLCGPLFGSVRAVRAADINVILDQARLIKLPDRVATIVIGNPSIADASVQFGGWMVVTGKSYGLTNIVAVDRSGAVLMEKTVEVEGPQNTVVVHRGVQRDTYSCTPECSQRLTLGDGTAAFDAMAHQIQGRNALAAGAAQARQ